MSCSPELRKLFGFGCDMMAWTRWRDFHEFPSQTHRDMLEQEENRIPEAPDLAGDAQAIALARTRRP
eukprot:3522498-Pyramimonas_sp.AAC.1